MKIEDLADAIEDELNIYAKGSAAVVKNAVKDAAKEIKDGISAGAPVGVTGKYAKSWRVKKTAETDTSVSYVIHANKDGYRLAHLLEFGHVNRDGGRTDAKEHIGPAEKKGKASIEKKIRSGLK
jgi:hypothetical protein